MGKLNWLTGIFKGRVSTEKVFDSLSKGIDKMSFSTEERAHFNMKAADKTVEFYTKTLGENTVRSYTRRFIGVFSIVNIFAMMWLLIIMEIKGINISGVKEILATFRIGFVFITIITFFFGGYYISSVADTRKEQKLKEKEKDIELEMKREELKKAV